MNTFQQLLQKFYFVPVIIIWLFILVKHRRILGFRPRLLKAAVRPGLEVFLPLLAIMAVLLTLAWVLPFAYDESFTFTQFTYPGPQQSLFNYPAPNNHVFHSLLTCITWRFFYFMHSELSVRLPALCFTAFSLYFIFTRYLERNMYAVVLFSLFFLFSPNIIELAFQARGYSIMVFCGVTSYFFTGDNTTTRKLTFLQRLNIVLLLSVIGLFTNPSYLYTAGCIYLIFVTIHYREIKKEFISFALINVFYGLTVLLLYTPIIASKGLHTITANENVVPVSGFSGRLLSHLKFLVNFITLPSPLSWIVLILFIWNTVRQKLYYNVYLLAIPVILMCILKQTPFGRVFLPIGAILLVNACMAITGSKVFKRIPAAFFSLKHQIPGFLVIAAGCVLSYFYFNNYHQKDDLRSAYYFKEIRPYISDYNKVYTKSIESDWDLFEILSATLRLNGVERATEIEKDLKEYDFASAIIISTEPVGDYKIVDSTAKFDGKPIFIIDPKK
ncbi:hypothetical protein FAM09_29505 [Niastella caeni]|uniref:Glycosyltransferase RgtA/B/C/D-like domain-containing protein n=1 Tax=Niastella caeni TaxID=2569763 RepID=A0A4S8H9M0_9BACT|nr:hypothetical protein [Niastella caeni]THU30739.1 hypothetical protein FAM09_29505 [Niastella caeni]